MRFDPKQLKSEQLLSLRCMHVIELQSAVFGNDPDIKRSKVLAVLKEISGYERARIGYVPSRGYSSPEFVRGSTGLKAGQWRYVFFGTDLLRAAALLELGRDA